MPPECELLELRRFGTRAIGAANQLACRLPLYFMAADQSFQLFMPGQKTPPVGSNWTRLLGCLDGHNFTLTLDPALLPPLAAAHLSKLDPNTLAAELRGILLSVLLHDIDELIEDWCGARPEWAPDGTPPEGLDHTLAISYVEDEPEQIAAILKLDDGALAHVAQYCRHQTIQCASLDHLPIVLDLLLDHATLSLAVLQGLHYGDIVLIDHRAAADDAELDLILRVGNVGRFRARGTAGTLTLITELDAMMDVSESEPIAAFDDLEVTVEFLVGQITLPLSRLRELAAGQVLDLGFDATTAVSLRVNGQTVATGELVRIQERVGVRITDLRLAHKL